MPKSICVQTEDEGKNKLNFLFLPLHRLASVTNGAESGAAVGELSSKQ